MEKATRTQGLVPPPTASGTKALSTCVLQSKIDTECAPQERGLTRATMTSASGAKTTEMAKEIAAKTPASQCFTSQYEPGMHSDQKPNESAPRAMSAMTSSVDFFHLASVAVRFPAMPPS